MIARALKDILTGIDNSTFDSGRVLSLTSFAVFYGLAIHAAFTHHPWGAMDYAEGVGTMAVGFGLNLMLKSNTEPGLPPMPRPPEPPIRVEVKTNDD